MPKTIVKIKTWSCATCEYKQDFEPTEEKMHAIFNLDDSFINRLNQVSKARRQKEIMEGKEITKPKNEVGANECPSCLLKGTFSFLTQESNPDKRISFTIAGEEQIEDELDPNTETALKHKMPVNAEKEKDDYRDKRKDDIKRAIAEAKLLEDK